MLIKKLMEQPKEPKRDFEGEKSQVEDLVDSEDSDEAVSSQLIVSRFTMKKLQELFEVSRFNPKYFENKLTLKTAKKLVRYNEADSNRPFGV